MKYRMIDFDSDGKGKRPHRCFDMPPATTPQRLWRGTDRPTEIVDMPDYWAAVTDVPCPRDGCEGTIRWNEAGYVPGYRRCDTCGRNFYAKGTIEAPTLILDAR